MVKICLTVKQARALLAACQLVSRNHLFRNIEWKQCIAEAECALDGALPSETKTGRRVQRRKG